MRRLARLLEAYCRPPGPPASFFPQGLGTACVGDRGDNSNGEESLEKTARAIPLELRAKTDPRAVGAYSVGQVMRILKGQADPRMVGELIEKKLAEQAN